MALVLDTHAVIWYLADSSQLSLPARSAIENAQRQGEDILISAISLVEIVYLCEKGRLPTTAIETLREALRGTAVTILVAPLDADVAERVQDISRSDVPDMPDRIIAATALRRKAALVTRDRRLQGARLQTIW